MDLYTCLFIIVAATEILLSAAEFRQEWRRRERENLFRRLSEVVGRLPD